MILTGLWHRLSASGAQTPPDAFTAQRLGTDRSGHGVLIREDGLILTIGYLINEAGNRVAG